MRNDGAQNLLFADFVEIPPEEKNIAYSVKMQIRGSSSIEVKPLAAENKIAISGNWRDPSFIGKALPDSSKISDSDFSAEWNINSFGALFKDKIAFSEISGIKNTVGTELIICANSYQKMNRLFSYEIFISLMLMIAFFGVEFFTKTPSCLVQYATAAASIFVYYMLMFSLSEHMNFTCAYIISAVIITAVLSAYTRFVFDSKIGLLAMLTAMCLSFAAIYVILSAENMALLIGSFVLLIMLIFIMLMTGRLNKGLKSES